MMQTLHFSIDVSSLVNLCNLLDYFHVDRDVSLTQSKLGMHRTFFPLNDFYNFSGLFILIGRRVSSILNLSMSRRFDNDYNCAYEFNNNNVLKCDIAWWAISESQLNLQRTR